ncbi:MAG: tRNA pseudouridine(55) synthase TruB [Clostridia bacterium]|nr:tRNA pseudouridine(55) synthase TruB [Clostridia bacterium]
MTGILLVDKPEGLTSFGTLIKIKKIIKQKKCGHCGTLDPMATGVLTVLLGGATKFAEILPDSTKAYRATVKTGIVTDTLDITGRELETNEAAVTKDDFEAAAKRFLGRIKQVPPMYSAVSVDGKRLYELARKGETVERRERDAEIFSLDVVDYDSEKGEFTLDVACSSGTYIRTLADDIGRALGCGAALTALRRTVANGYSVENALTLEELEKAAGNGELEKHILTVDGALETYPAVYVTGAQAARFGNGGELMTDRLRGVSKPGYYRVYAPGGAFLGAGENRDGSLYVKKLFKEE